MLSPVARYVISPSNKMLTVITKSVNHLDTFMIHRLSILYHISHRGLDNGVAYGLHLGRCPELTRSP